MEARAALMQVLRGPWVPPRLGRAPYLWLVSLAFFGWKYFYVRPSALELAIVTRNYLSEAIGKCGAANRVEAYRMARDAGWL